MYKNSNKLILQQVRESYRFLFEYQSRVLNLMTYIEKRLGVSYSGGFSKFSNPSPRNGKGSLSSWAWDWLNMYYYEFHFGFYNNELKSIPFSSEECYGLSIFLLSDDGYFINNLNAKSNKNRIQINSFKATDESRTRLIFVASKNIWDTNWWHCSDNDNSVHQDFITTDFGRKNPENNKYMIFKSYDLESFFEEDSALRCLKEFGILCNKNEIAFKVLENSI